MQHGVSPQVSRGLPHTGCGGAGAVHAVSAPPLAWTDAPVHLIRGQVVIVQGKGYSQPVDQDGGVRLLSLARVQV